MDFSIASLLASFARDKSLTLKLLEQKLGIQGEAEQEQLQIALDALEKIGILEKERGRYRRLPQEQAIEAKLRCSSKGFCFAIQDEGDDAEDVYIRECNLSNAWNGDRVLVTVTKEGGGRSRRRSPEGEVNLVLERSNPSVLARIAPVEGGGFRAVPLDDRLLFEVELLPSELDLGTVVDHLASVEIVRYPLGPLPPLGRVTKILGVDAESAADFDIVTCKYGLSESFPAAVLEAAAQVATPAKGFKAADLKNRFDARPLLTLAIDPNGVPGPKPILDRALTLETNGAGRIRLGIHVVEIARHVPVDSPLDREARRRGMTAYLGDRVLPIFPESLLTEAGSFLPESDRLAHSVLVTFNERYELLEFEIQPSIVRADVALTEAQMDSLLAGQANDPTIPQDDRLQELVTGLQDLAIALRQQRHQRGSFDLVTTQGRTQFHREGIPGTVITAGETPTASDILAELSICANQVVADHLRALGVPGLYRFQAMPSVGDVQDALKVAANLDVALELASEEAVEPEDYQRFFQQVTGEDARKVLNYLLVPTLKPCGYTAVPRPHFGLALPQYVTFNAPARHYADLWIQRILTLIFEQGRDRKTTRSKTLANLRHSSCHGQIEWNVLPPDVQQDLEAELATILSGLGDRERLIQEAEADICGLQKTSAMKARIGDTFTGLIVGVQSYGFFVEIDELQVEGLVHVSSLKDDWYEYRARQQTLIGRKSRRQYALGTRVEVEVRGVDYYRQQIDLAAISAGADSGTEAGSEGDEDRGDRRADEEE